VCSSDLFAQNAEEGARLAHVSLIGCTGKKLKPDGGWSARCGAVGCPAV
jgi:hypothetical protein